MALDGAKEELSSVQEQLVQAHSENETIKAVATVSENTKQEAIDQVRSQWQEEVASLQAIMKGNGKVNDKHINSNNSLSVLRILKLKMCVDKQDVFVFLCYMLCSPRVSQKKRCASMRSSTASVWNRSEPNGTSTASQWRGNWGSCGGASLKAKKRRTWRMR